MDSNRLAQLIRNQNNQMSFEELRIRYATERFLCRVAESQYRDNLVLKGGFLLGTIFKIEQRATRDLDALLKGVSTDKLNIEKMLHEIIEIDLEDGIKFELLTLEESQQERIYGGFRAKMNLTFNGEQSIISFDLDLGVGDIITPEIENKTIKLMFTEKNTKVGSLTMKSYPLETILAEKLEIILDLGTRNSRMKDFYNIHLILNYEKLPSELELYNAFEKTWNFRHKNNVIDEEIFDNWFFKIDEIIENKMMKEQWWENYIQKRLYAHEHKLENIMFEFKECIEIFQIIWKRNNPSE